MPDPNVAYLWGFGIGVVVTLLVLLRVPSFRSFILRLPILKNARK